MKKLYQIHKRASIFLLFWILIPALLTAQNNQQAQQFLNKASKSHFFIENKGQWPKQVKFLAKLDGMNCWITDSGVVYDYFKFDRNYSADSVKMLPLHEKDEVERTHANYKGHIVKMDYNGIIRNEEIQGINKGDAYYNYFIGKDSSKWASVVGLYSEVIIKDAYKGIDIRYYFDQGQIRYDYLIQPEADISQINFILRGANDVAINEIGELTFQTSLGEVKHGKLYAWQQISNEKKEVSCRFKKNDNGSFGITVSDYEKRLPLVIDPLVWSTFLGGGDDVANNFIIDHSNNFYLTGRTGSSTFPTTTGAYNVSFAGNFDVFITKLNSTASSLLFSTFLGGTQFDIATSIALDTAENVYICGYTGSNNYPTTSGSFDQTYNATMNSTAFITKLNPTCSSLIYSTYLGGNVGEQAECIVVDKLGYAYVGGHTMSANFPTTSGAFSQTHSGVFDLFVTKLNQTGSSLVYSTYIGGSLNDEGAEMVLDNNSNIYITGFTASANFPTTTGVYDQSQNGREDVFISKLNSSGSGLIFSTFIGGIESDNALGLKLDSYKNIYVCGYTLSTDYPTTSGSYNQNHNTNPGWDIFVSKLDSSATKLIASTYLGGNDNDWGRRLVIDSDDCINITGMTLSTDYPVSPNAYNLIYNGGVSDIVVSKFNSDLSKLIYSTYFGGSGEDVGTNILIDSNYSIYFTGYTASNNFPSTVGAYDQTFNSIVTAFLTKLSVFSQANNINTKNLNCSQMRINWDKTASKKNVVFMKEATSGFPAPINNTTYTSDTVFGLGSQLGNTGWYCVYNDTGSTVSVSGLKTSTNYRIMVLEYSGKKGFEKYSTDSSFRNPLNQYSGDPPKASFSIIDSTVCRGKNFIFKNNSTTTSGTISSIWWFGDGDSSSLQNPQHSYPLSNTYNVKLIVTTGKNCSDSTIHKAYVITTIIASFSINDSTQCLSGNNFIFKNNTTNSIGTFSSNWFFGDGNGSIIPDTSHTFASSDTFSVKLLVVSDSGCMDSVSKNLIVYPQPEANFMSYDSSQCLESNNFLFSNKSASANGSYNCLWNFGDSVNSTLLNPIHKYRYADKFTVTLIVTDIMGCKDTFSKFTWVHVHPEPLADFSITDSSQCLKGNVFVLTNNTTIKSGTFTQKWEFGDGFDTASYNSSHSYSVADTYLVKLLVISDWACRDSILKEVYVWPMPVAGFSINSKVQYLAKNNYLFTSTSAIPLGNLKYYWDFADGNTSTVTNPVHRYTASGSYKTELITTSDYGCADTFSDSLTVLKNPLIFLSFNVKNCCVGDTVTINNTSTVNLPDSFMNYLWDFGDGNQTIVRYGPKHIYYSAGTYYITLSVLTEFGSKDTLIDTIEIYPTPTVNITALPDTIAIPGRPITLTANGIYDQLLWFDSSTQQMVVVLREGKYWVTATFNNGCKSSDMIELTKGDKKDIEIVNVITPNTDGINDKLLIKNIDLIKPCKLIIYNRWGDELFSSNNYQNDWNGTYKGKTLPEGTYYYVLETKSGKVYKGAVNILK